MTKKPTHLHEAEPKELGPEPVDITGKEPVRVLDWDSHSLLGPKLDGKDGAIRNMQRDIIDHELNYLLTQPAWNRPAPAPYGRVITRHDDLCGKFLSMCRLDNIPVYTHEEAV